MITYMTLIVTDTSALRKSKYRDGGHRGVSTAEQIAGMDVPRAWYFIGDSFRVHYGKR